jgi:hypothetical protein
MHRKYELFALFENCTIYGIKVILIQIEEAHATNTWPIGLKEQFTHKDIKDRLGRAKEFKETYNPPFEIVVDEMSNQFENVYRAWPDRFTLAATNSTHDLTLIEQAEYGQNSDATINIDPVDVIKQLIEKLKS